MLDTTTKRQIDSARQILVGKVPDPKAQVDQITTALVYKFMDDMDKESQELGGEAKFFTNGFEKYSWTKLLDKKLSGQERLDLYAQAITSMSKNPHTNQLFRDIFKDAFLPYRDPETLSLFLKEINNFTYDHSENLGNAFEYLLSVLGSQGEAGQFRTPRHIIDFVIDAVDPKKGQTILDPACGTAGFLISAWKHILKNNSSNFNEIADEELVQKGETAEDTIIQGNGKFTGDLLTPSEKRKVMNHIVGYDISPDMVKLSLVNMYLHGFPTPHIYEYDTLTSEKRWDESFDVIIANPPFMTPKGGIRPHKRFSIQASRAEVLFIDYIINHLNHSGQSGIVVPDGIVSNKNNSAYSSLRKKLVDENNVYAVISLHPGVFKPYADVKTSILLIDKDIAKETENILFLDIEHDGFEKGNRKRPVSENDIPEIKKLIKEYKEIYNDNKKLARFERQNAKVLIVSKPEIGKDGKYILRSNKYRAGVTSKTSLPTELLGKHIVEVKEKNKLNNPRVFSVSNQHGLIDSGDYFNLSVQSNDLINYKVVEPNDFVFNPARANVGSLALNDTGHTGVVSPMYTVFRVKDQSDLVPEYLYHLLTSKRGISQMKLLSSGAVRQTLNFEDLIEFEIPIPPLSFQKSFENNHKLIKNAEKVTAEYEPYVRIKQEWKQVKLTEHFKLEKGKAPIQKTNPGKYTLVTTGEEFGTSDQYQFDGEAICVPLISSSGHGKATLHRIYYASGKFAVGNILMAILPKSEQVLARFYYYLFSQVKDSLFTNLMSGTSNVSFSIDDCLDLEIPLPTVDEQRAILNQIDEELNLVNSNSELIRIFEKKIEIKIDEIYNEKEDGSKPMISPIQIFPVQQAIGVILDRGFERGEMVLDKVLYITQEVYDVPLDIPFAPHRLGPWSIEVKKAITGGFSKKSKFFKKKNTRGGTVISLDTNSAKLLSYSNAHVVKKMGKALDSLLPNIKKLKSSEIECLATVCKVVQDNKTLDYEIVIQKMKDWKKNKFTSEQVQWALKFITHFEWEKKLIND